MTDKKELNQEELEKVSGGYIPGVDQTENDLRETYCKKIDKYETANHIGEQMVFVADYTTGFGATECYHHEYYYGVLKRSYEKTDDCGTTRTAVISVLISNTFHTRGDEVEINLDRFVAYVRG